jgi:hypothetical protein
MRKYGFLGLIIASMSIFIFSCKDSNAKEVSNAVINKWIYQNMKYDYLLTDEIPSKLEYPLLRDKSRYSSNIFTQYAYNQQLTTDIISQYGESFFRDYFIDDFAQTTEPTMSIPKLGDQLKRVYILAGEHTASASEMIINGLKPYMNITLIEDTTYGKNVGSISLCEKGSKTNTGGMQQIVAKIYNSVRKSGYTAGFVPDCHPDDYHGSNKYPRMLKPLGDEDKYLLSLALKDINGELETTTEKSRLKSTMKKTKGRVMLHNNRKHELPFDKQPISLHFN